MSEENGNVTKALTVLKDAVKAGALAFVTKEDCMAVTPLYKPEITVIQLRLPADKNDQNADVYNISGKYMPKREIVDRIGEATGLIFIHEGCKTWTETYDDDIAGKRMVYVSEQQAKKRMSDGSWRTSSVQAYEFDPVMRAMLDYNVTELNAQTKQTKNKWGKTLAQTILEYTKVARQRAETGARLRVIRELTNMPTAFSAEDAAKPLVFGRFAQNTDYILQTREGRAMASAQALGVDVASLFGGRKISPEENEIAPAVETEQRTALPSSSVTEYEEVDYEDSSAPENAESLAEQAAQPSGGNEFEELTLTLEQLTTSYKDILDTTLKTGQNPYKLAMGELDANNFNASEITRRGMIKRVKDFLMARGVKI
jgi:hypothetical protein